MAYKAKEIKPIPQEIEYLDNGAMIVPPNDEQYKPNKAWVDLSGKKFGRLTVIRLNHFYVKGSTKRYMYDCLCDCGNYTCIRSSHLTAGAIISCGCNKDEKMAITGRKNKKHGMWDTHIWHEWDYMCTRCRNKNEKSHGGRGITVCEEWQGSEGFVNFMNWAYLHGYYDQPVDTPKKKLLTLDRFDVDGNYTPENCRWITHKQQQQNKTNTIWFTMLDGTKGLHF